MASIADNFAMSTWTYEKRSLAEALVKLSRAGFKNIEIFGDLIHLDPRLDPDIAHIKKLVKDLGLTVDSTHSPCTGLALGYPRETLKSGWLSVLSEAVAYASELGARYTVVHTTSFVEELTGEDYQKSIDISLDFINELANKTRHLGVGLLVENLPGYAAPAFTHSLKQLSELFTDKSIGFCLDIGHAQVNRCDIESEIGAAADRLWNVHVSNNDGTYDQHAVPTEGLINWSQTKQQLIKHGYRNRLTLEIRGGAHPDEVVDRLLLLNEKGLL